MDERGNIILNVPKVGRGRSVIAQKDTADEFEATSDQAVDLWFDADPPKSCLIDEIADARTLEEVAGVLNMTRERVRQIEGVAIEKLAATSPRD